MTSHEFETQLAALIATAQTTGLSDHRIVAALDTASGSLADQLARQEALDDYGMTWGRYKLVGDSR